ncbi:MAG TPA: hypothetical protein ENI87_10260 [bacterium]|nr:hypothetical protein [bacterium]
MNLSEPRFLWALLALPLLWWLAQPPRPRQHVFTPHLAQWQAAMRALHRRPPRGSWLRWLLLAVALTAAAFAAAGPSRPGTAGAERLVVLLDASASMGAAAAGEPAFARARRRLAQTLAQVPASVDVTVVRCGGELLRRHGAAARALQDLGEPSGALAVDLVAAARAIADARTAVWTLTDGQGQPRLPDVGALTVFDTKGPNAALVDARIEDAWPLPELRLEVDVVAYAEPRSDGRIAAELLVAGAVRPLAPTPVLLVPGQVTTVPLSLVRRPAGGELRVAVRLADDRLPDDDGRRWRLPALPAPRIAVLADEEAGPFVSAAGEALAVEVAGEVVAAHAGTEVGLLLADGGLVPLAPGTVRALTFGSRLDPAVELAPRALAGAVEWDRTLALTRGLDLSELRVERCWPATLPAGEPFLWVIDGGERVPLGVVVDGGEDRASVHFAFRLADANLGLLAAFPQLLRRAFVRCYGKAGAIAATSPGGGAVAAGETDLRTAARAPDRPLPPFAVAERPLGRWFVALGLLALALRACVR